jgi:DNA-binding beta-propeller fold protein YncE
MLAALLAPAEARAEVRRRVYLPTPFGVKGLDVWNPSLFIVSSAMPRVLAFSPDGRWMYGAEPVTGSVLVYDLSVPNAPISTPVALFDAVAMVVTPDGERAYVALGGGNVEVVNLAGPSPFNETSVLTPILKNIAVSPDGAYVYGTTVSGNLVRINTTTNLADQSLPLQLIPSSGFDITPDGTRAVVAGTMFGTGRVQRVNLVNWTLDGLDIPVGGDPRGLVITPDGTTALVADYEGRVLFVDLATAGVTQTVSDLSLLNALNSIDIEPNGLTAWFIDDNRWLYSLDMATRTVDLHADFVNSVQVDCKFIGKPVFYDSGSADVVNNDAELTTLGFGREVIVQGPVDMAGSFVSDRTFRFNDTPSLRVFGSLTLTGTLRGSGFMLTGGGTLRTTGTYTLGDIFVGNTTLRVDGTHNGAIDLFSGAILRGEGAVGNLTARTGSSVRPGVGSGAGILTSGVTVFESGSTLAIDIHGPFAGLAYDRLDTTSASFQPGVTLQTSVTYPASFGDAFTILSNHNGATFPFDLLPEGSTHTIAGVAAIVRYTGGDGNDVTLQVHMPPTASAISDDSIDEDAVYNGSVTIGDDLTPVNSLTVTATSSNTTLVPNANIVVGPTGSVRSLQITPAAELSGSTTITVRVSDSNWFAEETFVLTVDNVNDPPTASPIGPHSTAEDATTNPIALTVGDIDSPVADLIVTATSSDQAIVPNANIVAGGSGADRTITVTPAANAHGIVTITVRTSDGTGHTDTPFQFTVTPEHDVPSISSIGNQTIEQDTTTGPIPFAITDADGFADHTVTASSSNLTLVPNATANLIIGGANGARTITIAPAAGQHGVAMITVTVDDGQTQDSTTFQLTVNEVVTPPPPITYYLAEGATGAFFDTDLLLANPNPVAAPVTLTWLLEGGGTITQSRTLAPMSRMTIAVDDITGLENAAFSTLVTSTEGRAIAVERTMRWGSGGYGAHTEKATDPGGTTWYFAEGAAGYFSTYLLLGNPQATANTAHVTWLREGEPALTRSYPLLPNSRLTVDTRADAELSDRSFGARVVFDQPGVAERAMYFGTDPLWSGGHGAAGQTSLATRWDFAEGATGTYFTTFLLVANPGAASADVTLTFFPEGGTPVTTTYTLAAGQRMTRNIAFEHPSLANTAVATRVTSTGPIVVERAQYWGVPAWIESHSSFGVTNPGRRWALAEGRVGGDDGAQTYILLSNPGDSAATATLTFLRTDGTTIVKPVDVPAASRITIGVTGAGSVVPELVNESFGTLIESTLPIVVERSLYSNANGVTWAAGTNATATALPEP